MSEELSKIMEEIKKKAYNAKDDVLNDANKLYTTLHNTMNSELAKAKKEGKKVDDIQKEFADLMKKIDSLRENQKKMSTKDLRNALARYTEKAEKLIKKIKS
ncbi:hypothetical protein [Acidianus sp. HS-5]|uniref:hypothetical protein n=1 Tax=Acidianus sp. HS-5 TaxID=2886040 RepID=UPI001F2290AF|nr:hypothetical protein [Acidianus sp. HS-5]BDC18906.1 hypothetical protein HS5_17960 [Acidianus sp. HS-5]